MITVNIHEAKIQLSRLLADVEAHQERIRICRNGKSVAEIVPITSNKVEHLKQNPKLKGVKVYCDLTAPLIDDEWTERNSAECSY